MCKPFEIELTLLDVYIVVFQLHLDIFLIKMVLLSSISVSFELFKLNFLTKYNYTNPFIPFIYLSAWVEPFYTASKTIYRRLSAGGASSVYGFQTFLYGNVVQIVIDCL